MGEEIPRGVTEYDREHKEFVEKLFEAHPPGCYLLGAGKAVNSYFKMEKARWLSLFLHDYSIAFLRGDEGVKEEFRKAYAELSDMLAWPERELWRKVEESPVKYAEKAADAFFNFYSQRLRVEGWRERVEDEVSDGLKRRLDSEPSLIGDKFRTEYGRWISLRDLLELFEEEVRVKDRVAFWESCMLEVRVKKELHGKYLFSRSYLNYVIEECLTGRKMDHFTDAALWLTYLAVKRCEQHARLSEMGSLICEDLMVSAAMAASHVEPAGEGNFKEIESFLSKLEEKFNMQGLLQLYRTARFGPEEKARAFWTGIIKEEFEMSKEEREFFKKQREASEKFFVAMFAVVQRVLGVEISLPEIYS